MILLQKRNKSKAYVCAPQLYKNRRGWSQTSQVTKRKKQKMGEKERKEKVTKTMAEIRDRPGLYLQITNKLHRRRNSRRRLSVAPASTPAASALQLIGFGLRANLGKGKLLGGGETVNRDPENFSKSLTATIPADRTLETSFGRSFGSGPEGLTEVTIKDSEIVFSIGFKSSIFDSSSLLLDRSEFDFFGVRDWSLVLLDFLLIGYRLRDGRGL